MTTANLSVGLKTKSAKDELLALKAWMQAEMKGVKLDLGTLSLESQLKGKSLKLDVDEKALTRSVHAAVKAGLAGHHIEFDRGALTEQVRAAVAAGLSGARLAVGVQGTAGAGAAVAAGPELKTMLQQVLVPAVDELSKAAALVGGVARQAGITGSTGRGVQATQSFSATNPDTGERLAYRKLLSEPEVALANITSRNEQLKADREHRLNWSDGGKFGPDRVTLLRARDFDAAQQLKNGMAFGPDRNTLEKLKRDYDETLSSLRAKSASKIDPRTILGLPSRDETKAMGAQIAAQMRDGVEMETLRAKSASKADPRTTLGLPSRDETKAMGAQIAAQMRDGVLTEQARMGAAYERAKFQAGRSGSFTATGVKVAGAGALVDEFGEARARAFLGRSGHLVDEIPNLQGHIKQVRDLGNAHVETEPKVRRNAQAHRAAKVILDDAHSAARGLTGSLGALWLTWGNTAMIAGAAALGGALRSVFTVGKDLEYQLTFVKVLANDTSVSMDGFASAVRAGMLIAPTEAAQAMRGLAQNGLTVREALQALPSVLQLATAGEMSLSEAALGATGVMAAFNLQVSDLGHIGDVFAKAAALSNTSVQSMVESMKQASTVSDQYHVSLEETAASLAVLAKRNIAGTAAGTAFRNMMVELATPHEKARRAMQQLGLQLYDNSGQLKSYSEVLRILHDRTIQLNEKGRLTFLNEVFGERGAKAVNALLADFNLYGETLTKVTNESRDFAASVAQALGETTQGKIKALLTEFQLSASHAFQEVNTSANHFIDSLRVAASSPEFRNLLKSLAQGVTQLTSFLVEHAKTVGITVAAWAGFRVLNSVVNGLIAVRSSMLAAETAALGLAAAGRATIGAMTGGLGLIVALAAEFLLLHTRTNGATEAQKAFDDQMKLTHQTLDESLKRLRDENSLLERRISLQNQGLSGRDADKQIEREDAQIKKDNFDAQVAAIQGDLRAARISLENARADRQLVAQSGGGNLAAENSRVLNAQATVDRLTASLKSAQEAQAKFNEESALKASTEQRREMDKRLQQMKAFNDGLFELRQSSKGINLDGLFITRGEATAGDIVSFDRLLAERTKRLNEKKETFNLPDKSQHRLEIAQSRELIGRLNDEKAELKDYLKFRRDLDQARYNPNLFGPFMQAAAAEQRQIQETIDLQRLQTEHTERLRAARARLSDPADRVNMDREIQQSERESARLAKRLDYETQLAHAKALTRSAEDDRGFKSELSKLDTEDKSRLDKLRDNYAVKGMAPVEAAALNAQLRVREGYAQKIAEHELAVQQAQENLVGLQESLGASTADEAARKSDLYIAALRTLGVEESRLAILKAQAAAAAATASATATQEAARAQEAGYGWDRFWAEYRSNAESNATAVYDIMKKTTGGMGDMMATFATTGKGHFRSFAASVAAEAARMLANRAIMQLLQLAVSLFGPQASYASGVTADTAGANGGFGWKGGVGGFANGGIMTSEGPVPLRRYATGGVAYGRQFAEFAEGSRPEAYVPLPDGRSIPVTVQGGGGGGGVVQANVQVHLHGDGRTSVESDASGEKAAKLGELINRAITEKLIEEKRPGGLLHA